MLREAEDDMALDAIIGIETLLSGDTQGEITYTISNRMAVVAAMTEKCPYIPAAARNAMKIIYGLRSDIVHGRSTNKNCKVTIKNQEYLYIKSFVQTADGADIGKESCTRRASGVAVDDG